ncbi:MAG TPA: alginate lyase family protein, partial [Longimicrobiales bacterium]
MRVSVLVGLALACGAAVRAQEPATILWRGEELARARAGLRAGDTALVLALRALGAEARAALHVPPQSVVQKERTPPSEDKHDYMSFGPYWWPDRTKPGGVPYIRRDGRRNPEAARDSDSPRQATMVHAVEALALGWYFTGDTAVARHAGVLLRAWYLDPATRMNPNLEYGQGVPGLVSGRGTGIIDTHILPGLLDAVRLLDGSGALLADEQQGLRDWMRQYLHWLESSRNGSEERRARNNHGSWYDVQVADLALFVGDTAAARAALERGKTRIAEILPDGREPLELARTRSLDYSAFNLDALTSLAELGRRAGVDLWHYTAPNGGSIPAALRYLAPFADPRRPWPGEQITQPSPDFLL